ncbi:unnamed protein product [Rangifer tarandus platyrhynchus]|uniref:Mast cell-expressed membrane protein 1 n=1 Tax=Rangifer tarandus platyrhynchus TaxID=3082113 RepID=A0ABN8ZDF3_RANTA|nr:unnamed protein product [Rangifer tarandus platyrhynchus]
MQAVAFKHKRRGSSGNKEAADDPNYENITFTFKNQNQPKGSHSPPNNKGPAESRPPSDTAQEHHWLPKAMMSLNTVLTLSCMVLLALVLVKNFEVSRELVVLKEVLWKGERKSWVGVGRVGGAKAPLTTPIHTLISISVQRYQEEQKTQWATVKQNITAAKQSLDTIKRSIQDGNLKQRQLATVEFHGHARPPAATLRNRRARPAHMPVPSLRLRTPPFTAP